MQRFRMLKKSLNFLRNVSLASRLNRTTIHTSACCMAHEEIELMKSLTDGKKSYTTTSSQFHLVPNTIGEIIDQRAEEVPNKLLYAFPHQRTNITFGELKQRVDLMAQNLLELGFKKGERIAIALPNTHELAVTFLAASQIGLVSVVFNPAYQITEFEYMLKKTRAKGLVIYDSFKTLNHMELMKKLCPEMESSGSGEVKSANLPDLKHVLVLNSPLIPEKKTYKGTWKFDDLSNKRLRNEKHQLPYVDNDDSCLILFTSGTTGKPKGALLTQSNLLNSAYLSTVVVGNSEGLRMICNPVPLFHIFGLNTGLLIPLLMGTSIVFPFYFPETLTTMKAIEGYKCNTLRGTPTQFVDLISHPERTKLNLTSLENAIIGGSTVLPDLLAKMKHILKLNSIIVGYGMTETSLCHSVNTHYDELKNTKRAYESIGRTIPFSESKIVCPKTGHILPLNTDGELHVRGPHIMREYWEEKEKSAETVDRHGWLKTGDICSMDEDGFIYFKGRNKEIIIRGGANLYPAEIESFIKTHPDILDVHVFGVPDERVGEEIAAWIKLMPNSKLNEKELREFCKDKISHFKIPRYIKFVDSYPMNANAKVLKNVMREKAIAELKIASN